MTSRSTYNEVWPTVGSGWPVDDQVEASVVRGQSDRLASYWPCSSDRWPSL